MPHRSGKKLHSLAQAVAAVPDGSAIALGGNTVHRSPSSAVHEIIRQGKRNLTVIKTAGGYDVDILCGAGCVSRLLVAYVGFENLQGLAPRFRAAAESGAVEVQEQTCTSVITGMRAAAQGIPFMPIAGMSGSDIVPGRFLPVPNPYGGGEVITVPAIVPDWAIIHVQEADVDGNARIHGSLFEDILMARAAHHVLVTAERIVEPSELAESPELTSIPGFQVDAVCEARNGAWPASCAGYYAVDEGYLAQYYAAALSSEKFDAFLTELVGTHAPAEPVGAPS